MLVAASARASVDRGLAVAARRASWASAAEREERAAADHAGERAGASPISRQRSASAAASSRSAALAARRGALEDEVGVVRQGRQQLARRARRRPSIRRRAADADEARATSSGT